MSEPEIRTTDLRQEDFRVAPDDPFANDRLNRKESVESLCSIIHNTQGPLLVSVEGTYGTGKTAYLRMCSAFMEQLGVSTVEFNAWHQGHTGRPLIDLVAALSVRWCDQGTWDDVKKTAKQVGWRTIGYLSRGIVAPNDPDDPSIFDDWREIDSNLSEFRSSLQKQVVELGGRIVIFVDELDRCEPTYALDLLNKARHLFDIDGVAIVFGVNRAELGHAVENRYGSECDVDGYLRRFVDLSLHLRHPTTDEWVTYMTGVCESLVDCTQVLENQSNDARAMLTLLADNCGGKLRDIEQIVRHANLALPQRNYTAIWPIWMVCMITLRYIDRDCYQRLVAGKTDVWEVMQVMRKRLQPSEPQTDMTISDLTLVDSIVLSLAGSSGAIQDRQKFVARYVEIHDDESSAESVFEQLMQLLRYTRIPTSPIDSLHRTLEVARSI